MFDVSHNVANGTTVKTRVICSKLSQAHEVEGSRKEIDSIFQMSTRPSRRWWTIFVRYRRHRHNPSTAFVHWYIEPMNDVHCAHPGCSFRPAHV